MGMRKTGAPARNNADGVVTSDLNDDKDDKDQKPVKKDEDK